MTGNELFMLLKTAETVEEIDLYREEILTLIPQLRITVDYDQKNNAHQYDLWMHSLHTVLGLPRGQEDSLLYLAALLHDIGKPESRCAGTREGDTNMHYYGHALCGRELIEREIIPQLSEKGLVFSEAEKKRLLYYVEYHDDGIALKIKTVRRHIRMVSLEEFKNLMLLQIADAAAHVQLPAIKERAEICRQMLDGEADRLYGEILAGR